LRARGFIETKFRIPSFSALKKSHLGIYNKIKNEGIKVSVPTPLSGDKNKPAKPVKLLRRKYHG